MSQLVARIRPLSSSIGAIDCTTSGSTVADGYGNGYLKAKDRHTVAIAKTFRMEQEEMCYHFDKVYSTSTATVTGTATYDATISNTSGDGNDGDNSQRDIFEQSVQQCVVEFVRGFNATVLCTGATRSGKTFTLIGEQYSQVTSNQYSSNSTATTTTVGTITTTHSGGSSNSSDDKSKSNNNSNNATLSDVEAATAAVSQLAALDGIIPRSLHCIFNCIEQTTMIDSTADFYLEVSFVELTSRGFRDLLVDYRSKHAAEELMDTATTTTTTSAIAATTMAATTSSATTTASTTTVTAATSVVTAAKNESLLPSSAISLTTAAATTFKNSLLSRRITPRNASLSISPTNYCSNSSNNYNNNNINNSNNNNNSNNINNSNNNNNNNNNSSNSKRGSATTSPLHSSRSPQQQQSRHFQFDIIDIYESVDFGVFLALPGGDIRLPLLSARHGVELLKAGCRSRSNRRINNSNSKNNSKHNNNAAAATAIHASKSQQQQHNEDEGHMSSRSHAIYTVYLERRTFLPCPATEVTTATTTTTTPVLTATPALTATTAAASATTTATEWYTKELLIAKLHMVDLAGIDRLDNSNPIGDNLQEIKFINSSLNAFGDVLRALAKNFTGSASVISSTAANTRSHVPFLNSKLTHLLKESLSGNCNMVMIMNLSSDQRHLSLSASTLKFAPWARAVCSSTAPRQNQLDVTPLESFQQQQQQQQPQQQQLQQQQRQQQGQGIRETHEEGKKLHRIMSTRSNLLLKKRSMPELLLLHTTAPADLIQQQQQQLQEQQQQQQQLEMKLSQSASEDSCDLQFLPPPHRIVAKSAEATATALETEALAEPAATAVVDFTTDATVATNPVSSFNSNRCNNNNNNYSQQQSDVDDVNATTTATTNQRFDSASDCDVSHSDCYDTLEHPPEAAYSCCCFFFCC